MTRRRWFAAIALAGGLLLVASACAKKTEEPAGGEEPGALGAVTIEAGESVKVATLQAITGEVASLGTDQVRAVEIAIEDRGGEILGHQIELQSEDDLCDAKGGTSGAEKIISDPQVVGIIGTSCSGAAVPASQIMSEAGLLMISGSNTSPALTSDLQGTEGEAWQPGYYRVAHNDLIQGQAAATFAFEELGAGKAATIHDGDPYTEGLANAFANAFEDAGGEIVLATAINKGDTDMKPVLTEVAAAEAELIFFPIFQPEGDFIAKQAKEVAGLEDAILMGADGLLSDTYVTIEATKGMYFSGPASPTGGTYDEFVGKYEEKFGEKPIQAFHAHAYDSANMLFDAIEAVATEDGETLTIDREALRDALYATSGFAGLTGTLTCDEFGDCADPKIDIVQNTDDTKDITAVRENVLFTFEP